MNIEKGNFTPEEYTRRLRILGKAQAVLSGLAIGTGVGSYIETGHSNPEILIGLGLGGLAVGIDGVRTILKRKRFEETGR